jgi:predicted metal-dependent hydrolase
VAAPVNLDFSLWILDFGRYDVRMSTKSAKVAALGAQFRGRDLDPHYLGYFECFNRQLFYEAHEVLEELWLGQRQGPNALFYKGLIQLAGAFVHLQKSRPQPAAALFRLAQANLQKYPGVHERLDVEGTLRMIAEWLSKLELADFNNEALTRANAPGLRLMRAMGL